MFTKSEKQDIEAAQKKLAKYKDINKAPKKVLLVAASGMEPGISSKEKAIEYILDSQKQKKDPIIHDDSTSAWMHLATLDHGLKVKDISNMKFGETMRVVLMDRNVGDSTDGLKTNTFNPKKVGFSYATYIHGQNLTGLLSFEDIGVIHAPFRWELNLGAIDYNLSYWGPLECEECETINIKEMDVIKKYPELLVGWRGPAIRFEDLQYLPKKIKLYQTWWDDYGVSKYHDWIKKR